MEKLLLEMVEKAKKNKKAFLNLKNLAVELQMYELGAELRKIQLENFTETEEEKQAKEIQVALKMVELNADTQTSWVLSETFKAIQEKGKEFSLKDAAKIIAEKERIFA